MNSEGDLVNHFACMSQPPNRALNCLYCFASDHQAGSYARVDFIPRPRITDQRHKPEDR